jgi:hypothetical protein
MKIQAFDDQRTDKTQLDGCKMDVPNPHHDTSFMMLVRPSVFAVVQKTK